MARKRLIDLEKSATRKKKRTKAANQSRAVVPELGRVNMRFMRFADVNPAAYNPRRALQPGDPDYEKLRRSIEQFGYVDPLIVNERTGTLVGGHQRMTVLIHEYGLEGADMSVVDLDPVDEKALNVALNKIEGGWDEQSLKELLAELDGNDAIDATLTGFDAAEIKALIDAATPPEPDTSPQLDGLAYKVVVDCRDEAQQCQLLERFGKEGLTCRALIS